MASKQEGIKHWFCRYLAQFNGQLDYDNLPQYRKDSYKMMVEEDIMPYLHSQGVVIKVERELPKNPYPNAEPYVRVTQLHGDERGTRYRWNGFDMAERLYAEAGYVAVEPLIEE